MVSRRTAAILVVLGALIVTETVTYHGEASGLVLIGLFLLGGLVGGALARGRRVAAILS